MPKEATPSNAPGDFYVAKDECIACLAPEGEAPDLMGFDEAENSCFFRRQPATPDKLDRPRSAQCGLHVVGRFATAVEIRTFNAG